MLVYPDGRIVGTIGGGCVEAEMTWRARQAIEARKPQVASYDLTPDQAGEDGLVCGGRMQVFIEPIEGTPTLCLFGAGHVAQPLARMAKAAGFRVQVADDRIKFANRERFPDVDLLVVEDFATAAGQMTLGPNTYAVVVTRGHKGDAEALRAVVGKGLRFVGLLGSRPKRCSTAPPRWRRRPVGWCRCPESAAPGRRAASCRWRSTRMEPASPRCSPRRWSTGAWPSALSTRGSTRRRSSSASGRVSSR